MFLIDVQILNDSSLNYFKSWLFIELSSALLLRNGLDRVPFTPVDRYSSSIDDPFSSKTWIFNVKLVSNRSPITSPSIWKTACSWYLILTLNIVEITTGNSDPYRLDSCLPPTIHSLKWRLICFIIFIENKVIRFFISNQVI